MKLIFLTNNTNSEPLLRWLKETEEVDVFGDVLSEGYIKKKSPDWLISYNYRHIIKEDILNLMNRKVINLHYSMLPWNRGAYSNLWSFLEDTPKGVTIHLIDRGIDTGDILFQKELYFYEEKETLRSSYEKLQSELMNLFRENWRKIKEEGISPIPQPAGGSMHNVKDFKRIEHLLEPEGWDIRISILKQRYIKMVGIR